MDDVEIKKANELLIVKLIAMVILVEVGIDIVIFAISGSFSWLDALINVTFVVIFVPIMYSWYKVILISIPEYMVIRYIQSSGIEACENDGKIYVSLRGIEGFYLSGVVYDKANGEFCGSKYIFATIVSASRS